MTPPRAGGLQTPGHGVRRAPFPRAGIPASVAAGTARGKDLR
jgi:hypothetical protein